MDTSQPDRGHLHVLTRAAYTATAGHLEVDPDESPPGPVRLGVPVRTAVVVGVLVLLLAAVLLGWSFLTRPAQPVPLPDVGEVEPVDAGVAPSPTAAPPAPGPSGTPTPTPTATPAAPVVIHVAGAVAAAGVVELPAGARVHDAVEAAGGAQGDADLSALNLARVLLDGEQVYVPREGESPPPAVAAPDGGTGSGAGEPGGEPGGQAAGPVNLNTATAEQLDTLPGIGPALAGRILDWRDLNGGFRSVDDLTEVSGIGPATLERLRPLVSL